MVSHIPLSGFAAEFGIRCAKCGWIVHVQRDDLIARCGDISLHQLAQRLRCRREGCGGRPDKIENSPALTGWPGVVADVKAMDVWRAKP